MSVVVGGEVLRMSRAWRREREERGTPDTFRITSPSCNTGVYEIPYNLLFFPEPLFKILTFFQKMSVPFPT